MSQVNLQANSAAGYTLVEMMAVLAILALAAALAVPVFSSMSSTSAARAAAGEIANFVNRRAALARSGGGPSEIVVSGDASIIALVPEEVSASAAPGANTVLGHNLLAPAAQGSTKAAPGEEEAAEVLQLDGVRIEQLYARSASTGEAKDTLAVLSSGACDDALFALSCGGTKVWVSVRGLSGRARVYDAIPPYLAAYFGVPQDETARGK